MGVIFDLDMTLVDSSAGAHYRATRQWAQTYGTIADYEPYQGIEDVLNLLKDHNIPICIVTSSPRAYCERVLKQFRWDAIPSVCYHDTSNHKPHPEPLLIGSARLKRQPSSVISVGDAPNDMVASKRAGIYAVGAGWGSENWEGLVSSNPDSLAKTVPDLICVLKAFFPAIKDAL